MSDIYKRIDETDFKFFNINDVDYIVIDNGDDDSKYYKIIDKHEGLNFEQVLKLGNLIVEEANEAGEAVEEKGEGGGGGGEAKGEIIP